MELNSGGNAPIKLCWRKTDNKSKKLDMSFKRNVAQSTDAAYMGDLDSLSDDLQLIQGEIDEIS